MKVEQCLNHTLPCRQQWGRRDVGRVMFQVLRRTRGTSSSSTWLRPRQQLHVRAVLGVQPLHQRISIRGKEELYEDHHLTHNKDHFSPRYKIHLLYLPRIQILSRRNDFISPMWFHISPSWSNVIGRNLTAYFHFTCNCYICYVSPIKTLHLAVSLSINQIQFFSRITPNEV